MIYVYIAGSNAMIRTTRYQAPGIFILVLLIPATLTVYDSCFFYSTPSIHSGLV